MRLPVDTAAINFVAAGPPEPALDYDTKAQKTDEEGRPVFQVHLFAVGAGGRDVITVKIAGEPKGIGEFTPVRLSELVATTWAMGDRAGVSFRAAKLEPAVVGARPSSS
jgi:hypothetical protein